MEPSAVTLAGVEAPERAPIAGEERLSEEAGKPETAPRCCRTPPPNIPPVAIATGDGGGDGNGDEDSDADDSTGKTWDGLTRGAIIRRIYLGVPPEGVWPWLVKTELVQGYHLANLLAQPEKVGDPMQFLHRLGGHLLIDGVVLEWVEGRRLSYSYTFLRDEVEPPSRVTMELIRYGERMCRLELRHEDLLVDGETWRDVDVFWDIALSALKTWLETGNPLPWPGRGRWSDPIGPGTEYP